MRSSANLLIALMTLAAASSCLAQSATPAATSTPPTTEQELVRRLNDGEAKAIEVAPKLPADLPPYKEETIKAHQENSRRASKQADEMVSSLVKEIENLRQKDALSQVSTLFTQKPRAAKRIGSRISYNYKEGDVYEVYTAADSITDIQLQAKETLTNPPVTGDTVRWKLDMLKSGAGSSEVTHVILKPLDTGLETNFILTTNKRTYHLRAISGDWYMPTVSWNYPQEEEVNLSEIFNKRRITDEPELPPERLRFDYQIRGQDYAWKPIRVFDDGEKTYLEMPKSIKATEAPALFVMEDGEPLLANYRVKDRYYIVDRLFSEAQLRVGPKKHVEVCATESCQSFFERIF